MHYYFVMGRFGLKSPCHHEMYEKICKSNIVFFVNHTLTSKSKCMARKGIFNLHQSLCPKMNIIYAFFR